IPVHLGHAIREARPAADGSGVGAAVVCPLDEKGQPRANGGFTLPCDGIAMSVGWAAADGLLCQAGGRRAYAEKLHQFGPDTLPPGLFTAGRINGAYALPDQLADGERAGRDAAAYQGALAPASSPARPDARSDEGEAPSHPYPIFPHPTEKC